MYEKKERKKEGGKGGRKEKTKERKKPSVFHRFLLHGSFLRRFRDPQGPQNTVLAIPSRNLLLFPLYKI